MSFSTGGNSRIRTNIAAENAYNNLEVANKAISDQQLKLSSGKRINNASDDVAGYITSKSLHSRNSALKSALNAVGDATNVGNILMDALDNISTVLSQIKDSASNAASGSLGTDEKVALARAAYQLSQQIQTVADTAVFGGQQLLTGNFSSDFIIGSKANNDLLRITLDMSSTNADFNVSTHNFNINAMDVSSFGGVSNLDLRMLGNVSANNLGIFSRDKIQTTLISLSNALDNINKIASYMGGVVSRLTSQQNLLNGETVNYDAAISRVEDADVAQEQLTLVRAQFLQQASLTSLAQANQNPSSFLQLIRG